jgi:hypothetical protein
MAVKVTLSSANPIMLASDTSTKIGSTRPAPWTIPLFSLHKCLLLVRRNIMAHISIVNIRKPDQLLAEWVHLSR